MTPVDAQIAIGLLDLLLTGAERIAGKVAEARKQGLISIEEQSDRKAQIDALRLELFGPERN